MPDSSSKSDLEARAQRHHYRSLTPEEYEGLNHFRADWADVAAEADNRFFILGSFAEGDVDRVNQLKDHINREAGENAVAYRMDDFLPETDLVLHPGVLQSGRHSDGVRAPVRTHAQHGTSSSSRQS